MQLIKLPSEILLEIAACLCDSGDISRLSRSNKRLYELLDDFLYKYDSILRHTADYSDGQADRQGESDALAWAAWNANFTVTRKAIKAGADCNAEVESYHDALQESDISWWPTPMNFAILSGNTEMASRIIEHGGCVSLQECKNGDPAIFIALAIRSLSMVKFICQLHGFDSYVTDSYERGIMDRAVYHQNPEIVHYLLSLFDQRHRKISFETDGALHIACYWGHYKMVGNLLQCEHVSKDLNSDYERVIQHGYHDYCDVIPEQTPFSLVCHRGYLDVAKLLFRYDKRLINTACWVGKTPIEYAMLECHVDVVAFLLESTDYDTHELDLVFEFAVEMRSHSLAKRCIELMEELDDVYAPDWGDGARSCHWLDLERLIEEKYQKSLAADQAESVTAIERQ
ncbi:hypothetical protein NLG97_g9133 [Lecanicillium saksenae]|uniref:Uncharacterized protein n=1 Tax=Lecanicillium saksenae TaxID=468837 RepID=A0ACC1QIQ8_9HYPO|nr:hypothetical protein NLG97_g9133 [Lecanicillium saksenae]